MNLQPYPEYKDSGVEWLGEVPSEWAVRPLFALAKENRRSNKGMVENNLLSLSYGKVIRKDISLSDGLLPESFETYQIVESNDIVFRLTDLQNDKRSLRTALVRERGIITSAYLSVCPSCEPRFFAYAMRDADLRKVFYSMGGGLRQSMKYADMKWLMVVLPSAEEQRVIADFLDHETAEIDAFIADQNELIGLLNERRAATITQAVTKGLDPKAPMKDSGVEWLGDVPVAWTVHKLFWLARIGNGSTPSTERTAYWLDGQIPWLNSSCVNERVVTVPSKYVTPAAKRECHLPLVRQSSVLVGLTGQGKTRGMVTRLGIESTINQHLAFIEPRSGFLSSFAYWFLKSAYDYLRFISDGNGGTKGGLTCDQLGRVRVPLSLVEEQQQIADYLDHETAEIDAAIADAKEAIKLSKERRAALISAAVTGKIDVRDHASAEGQA